MLLFLSLLSGLMGWQRGVGLLLIAALAATACGFLCHPSLKSVAFTAWVFTFVAMSMFYPGTFGTWFGTDLKVLIVPLIQIIMFGMGTTLSLRDFGRVLTMPWPVFIGMVLQFSIMPAVGLTIAVAFGFEPEVAAGVILIGSVPGGVASNVMTYLARGDVALSVTMTACSTLLSPVMTPLLMKSLAGRFVPIDMWEMLLSILNMIVVPIVAGLIANRILYSPSERLRRHVALVAIALGAGLLSVTFVVVTPNEVAGMLPSILTSVLTPLWGGFVIGFALIAAVSIAKWVRAGPVRGAGKLDGPSTPRGVDDGHLLHYRHHYGPFTAATADGRSCSDPGRDVAQHDRVRSRLLECAALAAGRNGCSHGGDRSGVAERRDGIRAGDRSAQEFQCRPGPRGLRSLDEHFRLSPRDVVAPPSGEGLAAMRA